MIDEEPVGIHCGKCTYASGVEDRGGEVPSLCFVCSMGSAETITGSIDFCEVADGFMLLLCIFLCVLLRCVVR